MYGVIISNNYPLSMTCFISTRIPNTPLTLRSIAFTVSAVLLGSAFVVPCIFHVINFTFAGFSMASCRRVFHVTNFTFVGFYMVSSEPWLSISFVFTGFLINKHSFLCFIFTGLFTVRSSFFRIVVQHASHACSCLVSSPVQSKIVRHTLLRLPRQNTSWEV
jgi:hypothetical protein